MTEPAPGSGDPPRCTFEVFTLFPDAIAGFVRAGLLGKAIESGRVDVRCTDFRDFTSDRHRTVDDAPFGGGAGMVIKPGPVVDAMEHVQRERGPFHRVLLTPSAPRFDQRVAARLARMPRIGLLCGRYEGIDDRVREHYVDECLSLGDFVLGGGEVAALTVIEAVSRLIEGVVGNPDSVTADSFGAAGDDALLEHPHYTRPAEFRGHAVPPVLLGGDHGAIERWRHDAALRRTWALRPELRPRRRLPAEHPVHLLAPASAVADAAALALVARTHGVGLAVLGAGPEALPAWLGATGGRVQVAVFAEARALRRRLRRSGGGEPRCLALVDPAGDRAVDGKGDPKHTASSSAAPPPATVCDPIARRPEHALDLLASPDPTAALGPLLLWLGPDDPPAGLEVHAIYAPLSGGVDDLTWPSPSQPSQGLAPADAIADSSRPRTAVLAHAALTRLRDRG